MLPEQGLGDQIFYGAMLADLQTAGTESFVCLDGRLHSLFTHLFLGLDFVLPTEIMGLDPAQQLFGAQIHIASLGRFLRRDTSSLDRVPSPYLGADPSLANALRQRVRQEAKLICGLSWSSKNPDTSTSTSKSKSKSITLDTLGPLLQIPGGQFIDLQYGDTQDERRAIKSNTGIDITHLDDIDKKTILTVWRH